MTPSRAYKLASSVGDDPWVITPSVFSTELGRVRSLIDAVALDISRQADLLSANQKLAWGEFIRRWGAFYNEHAQSPWISSATSGPYYQIPNFEREALVWRQAFVDAGGHPTVPVPPPPGVAEPLMSRASPFLWGLLIVGGLLAVGYTVRSVKGLAAAGA